MMYCVSGQNLEKGETLGYNISVSVFQELQCVFVHVIKCFDSHSHYTVKTVSKMIETILSAIFSVALLESMILCSSDKTKHSSLEGLLEVVMPSLVSTF